jgi:hypothetical protein
MNEGTGEVQTTEQYFFTHDQLQRLERYRMAVKAHFFNDDGPPVGAAAATGVGAATQKGVLGQPD